MSSAPLPSIGHVAHAEEFSGEPLALPYQAPSGVRHAVHLFGQAFVLAAVVFGLKGLR